MKKRIVLASAAATLCLLAAVFCFAHIFSSPHELDAANDAYTDIKEIAIAPTIDDPNPYLTIDHAALLAQNPDYIGWIEIPGTDISYPMVQAADNDAYLRTTFDRKYSVAGSIFMDYRSSASFADFNAILYGHNMRDSSMFSVLGNYMTANFCKTHPTIHIYTPDGKVLVYSIFSAQRTYTSSDVFSFQFDSDLDKATWADSMTAHSVHDFNIAVDEAGTTITLVTCVGGGETESRYVVIATLIDTLDATL